ncbi:Uncharacterised protein [Citrobacter braakii]|nr:Uncharacterised protein [Citrobacter braakii]
MKLKGTVISRTKYSKKNSKNSIESNNFLSLSLQSTKNWYFGIRHNTCAKNCALLNSLMYFTNLAYY